MKIFGLTAVTGRIRALIASRQATSRYLHFSSLPSIRHHYGGTQARALPVLIGSLNPRITRFPCVPNLSRLIATETSGAETKLPLFPLFINGGKNSGLGFLSLLFFLVFFERGNGNKDSKVDPESQKPCERIDLPGRADENERVPGRSADAFSDHFKGHADCLAECSEKETGQSGAPSK